VVNLPTAAAGQAIQLRWRCATDVGNGNAVTNGWYIDSIGITGPVCAGISGAQTIVSSLQIVMPAPVIESISLTAPGNLVISWSAVSGKTYRLQSTELLGDTNWDDILPEVLASGPIATATNAVSNAPQRFYRVLVVQ
jgi:hypothetical protein